MVAKIGPMLDQQVHHFVGFLTNGALNFVGRNCKQKFSCLTKSQQRLHHLLPVDCHGNLHSQFKYLSCKASLTPSHKSPLLRIIHSKPLTHINFVLHKILLNLHEEFSLVVANGKSCQNVNQVGSQNVVKLILSEQLGVKKHIFGYIYAQMLLLFVSKFALNLKVVFQELSARDVILTLTLCSSYVVIILIVTWKSDFEFTHRRIHLALHQFVQIDNFQGYQSI